MNLVPLMEITIDDGEVTPPLALMGDSSVVFSSKLTDLRIVSISTGETQRTADRPGSGPGEFRGIADIAWCAPTMLCVLDAATSRVTLVDANLRHTGQLSVPSPLRRLYAPGPEGSLAAYSEGANEKGRPTLQVWEFDLGTKTAKPGARMETWPSSLPGLGHSVTIRGDRIAVGDIAKYRILIGGTSGSARSEIVRTGLPTRPVIASDKEAHEATERLRKQFASRGTAVPEQALREAIDALRNVPKPLLAIDGMALTPDGRLLVLRDDATGSRIDVYTMSGTLIAEWILPRQATRLVVSAIHVAASGVDGASGGGWVAVFALPRP